MKKILLVLLFAISVNANAQITFQKTFDCLHNVDYGYSIQRTFDGGYIVTGHSDPGGGTERNIYLLKTDSLGDTLWTKSFVSSWNGIAYEVQQTSDSGFILTGGIDPFGSTIGHLIIIKTNSVGDTTWTKTYGGVNDDWGKSIKQTFDGGYIVFGSTLSFGAGGGDFYLMKVNSTGDTMWTKTFGEIGDDYSSSIIQTSDSGFVMCGNTSSFGAIIKGYLIKTNSVGDTMWTKSFGADSVTVINDVKQTNDSGYIIFGSTNSFGAGNFDLYLIKTNASGDTVWSKTYGGIDEEASQQVQQTLDGGYIMVGGTKSFGMGVYDAYWIKTDANGNVMWSRTFGGISSDLGNSILQTPDSGFIIAGNVTNGSNIYDILLIKTDANGDGCNVAVASTITNMFPTVIGNPGAVISSGALEYSSGFNIEKGFDVTTNCSSVGFNEIKQNDLFTIFPNPATSTFTIKNISSSNKSLLQIFNPLGEIVYAETRGIASLPAGKNEFVVQPNLTAGIYFVRVGDGERSVVRKLVIQ